MFICPSISSGFDQLNDSDFVTSRTDSQHSSSSMFPTCLSLVINQFQYRYSKEDFFCIHPFWLLFGFERNMLSNNFRIFLLNGILSSFRLFTILFIHSFIHSYIQSSLCRVCPFVNILSLHDFVFPCPGCHGKELNKGALS